MEKSHVSCLRNMECRYRFIVHGGEKCLLPYVANSFKVSFGLFCGALVYAQLPYIAHTLSCHQG